MKILLVDDSKSMRSIQKRILEDLDNPTILEAGDGQEALGVIASQGPIDLILLDWNMPGMDGLTCAQTIRQTNKTVKIVMCTTEAEKTRVIEALKAGVNNYVCKPFTPDVLLDKVLQVIKKAA